MWLFLAFLMVPLIEIALFIQVGGLIGLWPTLAIVVITAVIGTSMMRAQGLRAMSDLQGSFNRLEDPTAPLAHGAMILLAGALLLTPGFFTDACGFALLVPAVRTWVMTQISARVRVQRFEMGGRPAPQRPSREDVIEGDYTEVPSEKRPDHPGSGWTKH